ncbi:hypothetical protein B0J12DRAFT_741168 [Macrophomina phaseolina]|uniref:VWFA domain-containing protein n=1 Tax=Macrophomina phaseolina TaxID=35725 RepID=A0ABQ8GBG4_9PEZI|nr:hypothetical protein B0J12DRAFT_741168 [Macrophomina phaseolina]
MAQASDVPPDLVPGFAKLALYDFVILCDNSESMTEEDRIPALRDTLDKVANIATRLSDSGISVRVLNHTAQWDNLRDSQHIKRCMDTIRYSGDTQLGTKLENNVLRPMIVDKIIAGTFTKPVIVVIITDGEPTNEAPTKLRDSIYQCDKYLQDKASVAYLISRVGTSERAQNFLNDLRNDPYIGKSVYAAEADLALTREVFLRAAGDSHYLANLVKLFLEALHVRTRQ